LAVAQRKGPAIPEHSQTESRTFTVSGQHPNLWKCFILMKVERILPSGRPVSPVADLLIPGTAKRRPPGDTCSPSVTDRRAPGRLPAVARLCPLPKDRNLSETLSLIGFERPWTAYGCSGNQEPSPTKPNKTEGSVRFLRRARLCSQSLCSSRRANCPRRAWQALVGSQYPRCPIRGAPTVQVRRQTPGGPETPVPHRCNRLAK
jgi:hypothetical protein